MPFISVNLDPRAEVYYYFFPLKSGRSQALEIITEQCNEWPLLTVSIGTSPPCAPPQRQGVVSVQSPATAAVQRARGPPSRRGCGQNCPSAKRRSPGAFRLASKLPLSQAASSFGAPFMEANDNHYHHGWNHGSKAFFLFIYVFTRLCHSGVRHAPLPLTLRWEKAPGENWRGQTATWNPYAGSFMPWTLLETTSWPPGLKELIRQEFSDYNLPESHPPLQLS